MLTLKDLESYLKVKDFMKKSDIKEIDSIIEIIEGRSIPLIVDSESMEPKKFYSLASVSREIGVSMPAVYYARKNKRSKMMRRKGGLKIFYIKWL